MKNFIQILLFIYFFLQFNSCQKLEKNNYNIEKSEIVSEKQLREKLNLGPQNLTSKEIKEIKSNVKPIYFKTIDEAKEFLSKFNQSLTTKFFYESGEMKTITRKLSKSEKDSLISLEPLKFETENNFKESKFIKQKLSDFDKGFGYSCLAGYCELNTTNQPNHELFFSYYVNFNYNLQHNEVSTPVSSIEGMVLGASYEHMNGFAMIQSGLYTHKYISFRTFGSLSLNFFVEGLGTVYKHLVYLSGSYIPCPSPGGGHISVIYNHLP